VVVVSYSLFIEMFHKILNKAIGDSNFAPITSGGGECIYMPPVSAVDMNNM